MNNFLSSYTFLNLSGALALAGRADLAALCLYLFWASL